MLQLREDQPYRVLAAVGDPSDLPPLLSMGCALARAHQGELTLLSVTPDGERPDWLSITEDCAGVAVEVLVRLGHSAGGAILAAVNEDPPDLLLLGWSGASGRGQYLLGSTLDPLVQKAPCDVAVLRLGEEPYPLVDGLEQVEKVLVPMRGGPNAALAVDLALSLSPDVQVTVLNIARFSQGRAGIYLGREQLTAALAPWAENARVQPKVLQAPGIIGGILNEAKRGYDLMLIGASQESYIDRVLFGNVPQTVASDSLIPTVVIKRWVGQQENLLRRIWRRLTPVLPSLTTAERVEAYRAIRRGARPDADFFLMIGLSATISALGLLLNSAAVIIGAMLVAPLMSAIVGLGLGVVQGDWRLLRLAAGAATQGMALSIGIGVLLGLVGSSLGLIGPDILLPSEILGRTTPSLLDLGIALASGAAGAYALCRGDVSAALPGVAIAAALVPPLASAGIGVALWNVEIAGGAFLLFFTNLIAIAAAGGLVFLWLGFRPELGVQSRARVFKGGVVSTGILLLAVTVPLGVLTINSLQEAKFNRKLQRVLSDEVAAMGDGELVDWEIVDPALRQESGGTPDALHLEVTVRAPRQEPSYRDVRDLQERVAVRLQRAVALRLTVIPVTQLDPFVPPTLTPTPPPTSTPTPAATSGPTPTPNASAPETPTSPPATTATATPAPAPTSTATATATQVPTPVSAIVSGTGGQGLRLRQTPGGPIVDVLPEGAVVGLLGAEQEAEEEVWVQVRDDEGQIGWVALRFIEPQP